MHNGRFFGVVAIAEDAFSSIAYDKKSEVPQNFIFLTLRFFRHLMIQYLSSPSVTSIVEVIHQAFVQNMPG